ncbi:MAG TPA: hypothetical protein PK967_11215 [Candidatus Hydrogenedentes bacterium]|nr:hypothetical protein [Candidatus Hydrogenedentota bacterium]HPC18558.1 hypothetical protein [Candidatus Hydrogenedentota bacterium]
MMRVAVVASFVLLAGTGAAAPEKENARTEASFCDYWPLAVGNEWTWCEGCQTNHEMRYRIAITDRFVANGFYVWELTCRKFGGWVDDQWKAYLTFVGDGVYVTPEKTDTQALPTISGAFYFFMPRTIVDGTPFTLRLDLFYQNQASPLVVTPLVSYETVKFNFNIITLIRAQGVQWTLMWNETPLIVGGCGGIYDVSIRPGKTWCEEGERLDLALDGTDGVSGVTYQWLKDGVPLPSGTGPVYSVEMLGEGHAGAYSCLIEETSKALHETNRVQIKVFPAGSLPVSGIMGILVLAAGCTIGACRCLRRP